MSAKVNNAFDIAFYFTERAETEKKYLQPQKLQGLLFLSQSYYCAVSKGQSLMPAVFVADERGPLEPNVHAAYSNGPPNIETTLNLSKEVKYFLDSIWRRFGHMTTDQIMRITKDSSAYKKAKGRGQRAEIYLKDMHFSFSAPATKSGLDKDANSKFLRTQAGKVVTVQKWHPKTK